MRHTGKVKWFDTERQCGVVIGVGGERLPFTADPPNGLVVCAGETVTYEVIEGGPTGPSAVALEPARRRSIERGIGERTDEAKLPAVPLPAESAARS